MENDEQNGLLTLRLYTEDILPFVFVIVLIVLMGGSSQNPDIENYISGYKTIGYIAEGSYLYTLVKDVFVRIGVSFEVFRIIIYSIGMLNIRYTCKKLGANAFLTYFCYAISLMMIDATQTYNFLGMSILLLGVAHLITDTSLNRTKYIIAVLLASGFHMAFFFYIPFIFIYRRTDNKQLLKIYTVTTAIVFLLSTVVSVTSLAGIIQKVLALTGLGSYQTYLTARTRFGHYYPMLLHMLGCLYSYIFYKLASKREYACKEICRIILLLNLYGIFAFPLFRFQLTIARLTRNLELLTFISGVVFLKERENAFFQILIAIFLVILAGIMGYFTVYSDYMDTIVQPFLQYNWILGRI